MEVAVDAQIAVVVGVATFARAIVAHMRRCGGEEGNDENECDNERERGGKERKATNTSVAELSHSSRETFEIEERGAGCSIKYAPGEGSVPVTAASVSAKEAVEAGGGSGMVRAGMASGMPPEETPRPLPSGLTASTSSKVVLSNTMSNGSKVAIPQSEGNKHENTEVGRARELFTRHKMTKRFGVISPQ